MNNDNSQRVETQPDEKPDKFMIFLNNKSLRKSRRLSINRFSLQNDVFDSIPRFRKTKYYHPNRYTLSNNSFLNKTTNPFELTSALKEEKEPETTRREENLSYKVPLSILSKIDLQKENENLTKEREEIEISLSKLKKIEIELDNSKKTYNKLTKELQEAKDSRNKIIQEVYRMKTEIENQKNLLTESYASNSGGGYIPTLTNTSYTNNELVEQIELYEDKICKLKMDNQSFLENYDNLCDDCKQNENQNQKLKKAIATLEQNINNALTEKSYLKNLIDKMNS